jgi:hypothetical protein
MGMEGDSMTAALGPMGGLRKSDNSKSLLPDLIAELRLRGEEIKKVTIKDK